MITDNTIPLDLKSRVKIVQKTYLRAHLVYYHVRHNWRCLTIHTQITLNLTDHKIKHLLCQRWLDTNPEGVVHHVVGVGQVANDTVVGAFHIWLSGEVAGKE